MGQNLVCAICGRTLSGSTAVHHEEQCYCADCFNSHFYECSVCGKIFPIPEMRYAFDSNRFQVKCCPSCFDNRTVQCEDCGYHFISTETFEWVDGCHVCASCYEENYRYCDSCNRMVRVEDWDSECCCCYECADENNDLIGEYHSQEIDFIGESKKTWRYKWRGLGFELEIESPDGELDTERKLAQEIYKTAEHRVNLERDSSLDNGFEIISHPHTITEFYKFDWSRLLELCKDYDYTSHTNGNCGLHVHVSRNMFGSTIAKQNTAIAKVIYFYENYYEAILKLSRRTAQQANQWAQRYCLKSKKEALHCSKGKDLQGRYYAVNLQNSRTIEFRLCRGTLKKEAFYAWIDFTLTLVRNSRKITRKKINDLAEWFKGVKPETIRYMKSRNSFFEGDKQLCA